MSLPARVLAGLAAVASVAAGLWVSLVALLFLAISAQPPDPEVLDGDPCCGHPDDWKEVVTGLGLGLALAYVALALVCCGAILLATGVAGRVPRFVRRHEGGLRAAGVLAAVDAVVVGLLFFV